MPCWCPRKIGMPCRRPFTSYRCRACVNPFGWDWKPLLRNVRKSPAGERLESCLHKASVCRGSERTAMKKYRSEPKGRRKFDTDPRYSAVDIIATEKTRTAKSAVRATCLLSENGA